MLINTKLSQSMLYVTIMLLFLAHEITVKPVLNGPFIKRNFVLSRNIFRSRDYRNIPWLNGNLASAEKCSGPLRFRLRQVLLTYLRSWALLEKPPIEQPLKNFPAFYGTWRFITVFTRALHKTGFTVLIKISDF
jgi:hypothetical protein